ncbi:hypothetical protein Q5752_001728 [Cryptotrichosporon argae]
MRRSEPDSSRGDRDGNDPDPESENKGEADSAASVPPAPVAGRITYYTVLGVEASATAAQVRKAYLACAARDHPDKSADPEATARFQVVAEAYETLSDPARRAAYDASLAPPPAPEAPFVYVPYHTPPPAAAAPFAYAAPRPRPRPRAGPGPGMYMPAAVPVHIRVVVGMPVMAHAFLRRQSPPSRPPFPAVPAYSPPPPFVFARRAVVVVPGHTAYYSGMYRR